MGIRPLTLTSLLLSSCTTIAPVISTTSQPPALSTEQLVATVVASGPIIEVSFDGTECKVTGDSEFPVGHLVTKFTNNSGYIATPWVARCYPDKTWQDVVDWIGPPGQVFHKETPPWLALPGHGLSVSETPTVSYRQYDLPIQADYGIWVEYPSDYWWPCGPFRLAPAQ